MKVAILSNGHQLGHLVCERLKSNALIIYIEEPASHSKKRLINRISSLIKSKGPINLIKLIMAIICNKISKCFENRYVKQQNYIRGKDILTSKKKLSSKSFEIKYKNLNIDILILAGAPIIPKHIIDNTKTIVLNAHPSLLPKFRGSDSIYWAYLQKSQFGYTIHQVNSGIDTGPIILQNTIDKKVDDNIYTLKSKINNDSANSLTQIVGKIKSNKLDLSKLKPQTKKLKYHGKLSSEKKLFLEIKSLVLGL